METSRPKVRPNCALEYKLLEVKVSVPSMSYWEPRVMRHLSEQGKSFAFHDVYFDEDGNVDGYTLHARSPYKKSVDELKDCLQSLLRTETDSLALGDLRYEYTKDELLSWLDYIDSPPITYE